MSSTKPRLRRLSFHATMARAVYQYLKWQTRRIVADDVFLGLDPDQPEDWLTAVAERCPYGKVGDTLYLAEAWGSEHRWNKTSPSKIRRTAPLWYEADHLAGEEMGGWEGKKRLPRYMPQWASRAEITLADIRIERLQDITEADARAEGCTTVWPTNPECGEFVRLWERVYKGQTGCRWEDNPLVWVLTFTWKRVDREAAYHASAVPKPKEVHREAV